MIRPLDPDYLNSFSSKSSVKVLFSLFGAHSNKKQAFLVLMLYVFFGSLIFSILPAIGFHYLEGWRLLDAWYFTIITLTTGMFDQICLIIIIHRLWIIACGSTQILFLKNASTMINFKLALIRLRPQWLTGSELVNKKASLKHQLENSTYYLSRFRWLCTKFPWRWRRRFIPFEILPWNISHDSIRWV